MDSGFECRFHQFGIQPYPLWHKRRKLRTFRLRLFFKHKTPVNIGRNARRRPICQVCFITFRHAASASRHAEKIDRCSADEPFLISTTAIWWPNGRIISGRRSGPLPLWPLAGRDSITRNWTCPERSRMETEILIVKFGKRLSLVQQSGKLRPRARIAYNSVPCHVAVQFGQKKRQILDQFFAFNRRKRANRSFDFMGGAHSGKNSTIAR
jgi:hypothetical protein